MIVSDGEGETICDDFLSPSPLIKSPHLATVKYHSRVLTRYHQPISTGHIANMPLRLGSRWARLGIYHIFDSHYRSPQ